MKQLFVIDLKDYNENDTRFCRPSARGIILKPNGKIALVYSRQKNYYKFPGGGIHVGEDKREALIREVKEEEVQEQNLDAYEMEEGFELRIVALDEAIATNKSFVCEDLFDQVMVEREAKVLELIREQCAKRESGIDADGR